MCIKRMCNEVSADATMWMLRGATSSGASRRTEKRPGSIFAPIDLADHIKKYDRLQYKCSCRAK